MIDTDKMVIRPPKKDEFTRAEVREAIKNFWYYWYNHQGGTNTEQALDNWMDKNV